MLKKWLGNTHTWKSYRYVYSVERYIHTHTYTSIQRYLRIEKEKWRSTLINLFGLTLITTWKRKIKWKKLIEKKNYCPGIFVLLSTIWAIMELKVERGKIKTTKNFGKHKSGYNMGLVTPLEKTKTLSCAKTQRLGQ